MNATPASSAAGGTGRTGYRGRAAAVYREAMTDDERRPLLRKLVGDVLRRHRQEQGRTLAEVAREACVSVQYLSEVERGRKEPSSEILAAVCDALRIELAELLFDVRLELVGDMPLAPVLQLRVSAPIRQRPSGGVMLLAA